MLNGQSTTSQNGLWLVQAGAWTRPTDFATGTTAGNAYVLIQSGTTYAGTSWVCSMPTAVIDTNPLAFVQFTLPDQTIGANVGAGAGQIFRDKTGNTLNFKTIAAGTHITVTNNANDVTLATDAASANTAGASVARDGAGNFAAGTITANLTGSATNFSGSLVGDVTGTQGATVVSTVGGQTATNVAAGTVLANAATNANTANTIVKRDGSGNFIAGTITANLTGDVAGNLTGNASTATTATTATNFTGSLVGDVTGTQGATVVSTVGGQTAANVAAGTMLANAATDLNTASAIVRRDGSGNFAAGTITANLTGTVTGSLVGNASTATSATTATTATNFSGSLAGDVTGTQGATVVSTVGGQTASAVATAATSVAAATPNNTASVLVLRDASKNFATNMITLNGAVTNPTDAATKEYVDTVAATGFTVHQAAVVYGASNVTLSGTQTIDGVALVANDRVLLNAQTTTSQNGLWLVQAGAWTRPTDFATGDTAGNAYVLIQSGTTYAGTSWACDTPAAVIDTNPISFAQFALAGQTTGANVGTGAGQIFRDKTGNTLNFKTVAAGTHITVTNNANDVTLATDAASANTASTLVARDGSGNFAAGTITASLTGAASLNVLKAGDTMTGNLNLAAQSETRWQDAAGSEYVGLRAPTTVSASYALDLPGSAPTGGQFLQAVTASTLGWTTVGSSPTVAKTYYVALNGNDTTGDGSLSAPYRTIKKAVSVANPLASASNSITISIGSGIFVEDNSGGPLSISNDGLSLVGSSIFGTIIQPNTLSNHLFSFTTPNFEFANMTLDAGTGGSTASGIVVVTDTAGTGRCETVALHRFATAVDISSSAGIPILNFNNVQARGNGTVFAVSSIQAIIKNSLFLGPFIGTTPSNTGVTVTGSTALVTMLSNAFRLMSTAVSVTGGALLRELGSDFETTTNGVIATGASTAVITGCAFTLNNAGTVNISATGAGTNMTVVGCQFDCADSGGTKRGTAVQVTTGGNLQLDSCAITNAVVGLQCGTTGDTSATAMNVSGVILTTCTTDINQTGTSTLHFISGEVDITKVSIANTTNVSFAGFDRAHNDVLSIGNTVDSEITLYQVLNGQTTLPVLNYENDYYGSKGTVYKNSNSDATFNGTQAASNNASYYVITGDNTKTAGLNLISDTANIGTSDNVRGWNINKAGTAAGLAFTYSNNDTSGQAERGANTVINLNGFDNQVEFPTATNLPLPTNPVAKLLWAGDTNLYRSASSQLKTDGNVIVGGLTASRAVATDGSQQLVSSVTTATELGYLSGTTSAVQTQIGGKVNRSGDTMTGTLTTQNLIVASAYVLANQSIVRVVPVNNQTVTIVNTTSILLLQPAGNINTINLVFPTSGLTNGQILTISSTANITNTNYSGGTINSQTAGFTNTLRSASFIYYSTTNQWYRIV